MSATISAIDEIVIALGTIEGDGWVAEDIELVTDSLFTTAGKAQLRIASLALSRPEITFSGLAINCLLFELTESRVRCLDGELTAANGLDMRLTGDVSIDYALSGEVSVAVELDQFTGGSLSLVAEYDEGALSARLRGAGLDAVRLFKLANKLAEIPDYQLAGQISLDLKYERKAEGKDVLRLDLSGSGIHFSNQQGTQAGENVAVTFKGKAARISSGWKLHAEANLQDGLLYIDPIYLDAGGQSLALRGNATWEPARHELRLSDVVYKHPGVLEGSTQARLKFSPSFTVPEIHVTVDQASFPAAYQIYVQPWVYGTALGDLDTVGEIKAQVDIGSAGYRRLEIDMTSLDLEDKRGRFSLRGLTGNLSWANDNQVRHADLKWQSGSLYRISLGNTLLPLVLDRDSVALREPVQIPVLDGNLMIDHWQLARPGQPDMHWSFDGVLTPISLEDISNALDWPPFTGKLSGVIPDVGYSEDRLTVGGVLLVRAFDGDLTVRDLSIEQPFGLVPRLSTNLSLVNLDLERLTSAFAFGKIEGRLSGGLTGLRLVNWQPVAFDAAFANPEDDQTRHRISQKAIDNLSNIGGGGVGNALSKTFLGIFKEFPYDRLGISCRLEKGVCHMGGVAPAPGGYYIVKGRFLPPRIDIVGYSDRVDWESLLARLKTAISSGGATVQ